MKIRNWFNRLQDEGKGTSEQIEQDVNEVDLQNQELKEKHQALCGELKRVGIENLAGAGSEKELVKTEQEIRSVERDMGLLADVRAALVEKKTAALSLEKKARIVEIDKSIKKLRAKRADMQEEAVSLGSHLAALLFLTQGTHLGEVSSLLQMDHQRGVLFRAEAQAIIEGQIPIREQERHLMNEKKNLQSEIIKGA